MKVKDVDYLSQISRWDMGEDKDTSFYIGRGLDSSIWETKLEGQQQGDVLRTDDGTGADGKT